MTRTHTKQPPAQEWRNGYLKFTRALATGTIKGWKTVDEHHLESLHEILAAHNLITLQPDGKTADDTASLWTEQQLQELNLIWHRLAPWPDTCAGLHELNRNYATCTLSNGNVSLLKDMVANGSMPFTHVYSAEMFQSYKPDPKVYLGAAEKMGVKPEECALVAAHLDDLKAAKKCGFGAVYVERAREERHLEMREEGIPDVWVKEEEEGFVRVAQVLRGEK